MTRPVDTVCISITMGRSIRGIGWMTTSMVKGWRVGLTEVSMQGTTDRARNTERGSTSGRTAVTTMEIGRTTR